MAGLVIFDCDGVLVDSEALACRVVSEVLAGYGLALSPEACTERFTGISNADMYARIEAEWGRPLPDDFEATLIARDAEVLGDRLRPVAGVAEALARIADPLCVASSSTLERTRASLTLTGLIDRFEPHLFSADQVANGKPAPDLFLFAGRAMGVAPASSVVVEDSIAGVGAGCAAGMRVLGFAGASHCTPETPARLRAAGADTVFDDMSQLPGLLEG